MNEQKRNYLARQLANTLEREIDIYIKFGLPQEEIINLLIKSTKGLQDIEA